MRAEMTIDRTEFGRTARAMLRATPEASAAAVRNLAAPRVRMAASAARLVADTGRFQRSIEQAHNDLGRGMIPLRPLRRSRMQREQRPRLLATARKWEAIEAEYLALVREYERLGRTHWKRYKRLKRTLDKIGDVRDRTIENLERIDEDGGAGAIVIGTRRRAKSRFALSNLEQVVTRIYGGRSTVTADVGGATCEVRSMEPHARLVERRRGIFRTFITGGAVTGALAARERYVEVCARLSGATPNLRRIS